MPSVTGWRPCATLGAKRSRSRVGLGGGAYAWRCVRRVARGAREQLEGSALAVERDAQLCCSRALCARDRGVLERSAVARSRVVENLQQRLFCQKARPNDTRSATPLTTSRTVGLPDGPTSDRRIL